ncbi:DUF4124 domain-containing protein [Neiella marina]|uniref:DUF4124 domain-containing protein n=1 Tax=Neiella holothuriorum TaxID=2870530 RepID=A0ABS7EFN6_9GAMM|nr:DUF4124 domain-containing protein [Neiella holothuriorum]MBW8191157.1 DUF4124 domain-containing protein [Neiella holothuriorum]
MKPVVVIFCLLSTWTLTSNATVYSWTDENGNVVYSDLPRPGADTIDLRARVQNVTDTATALPTLQTASTSESIPQPAISISEPENDATIRSAEGNLMIAAELAIPAGVTQRLQLLIDGETQGKPQREKTFVLTGVERGTHTLQLQLVNNQGSVLASSPTTTIHMHRPSKLHNAKTGPVPTPLN